MTTASTGALSPEDEPASGRRKGSLLRAEVHRFTARRFIRLLVLLSIVGFVVITTLVGLTQYAKPSPEALVQAQQRAQQEAELQNRFREDCVRQLPEGTEPDEACGPPITAESLGAENFVEDGPFVLADELPSGVIGIGVAAAVLAFIIGATYIGAEWSSRSIVALLFWEPRRLKVMGVKLAVTTAAALLVGVLAQLMWFVAAQVLARTRGTASGLPDGFWSDVLAQQLRSTIFVVIAGLLGFGLANLIRNTGAALGVGFVYFAIVESAVRGFFPRWQQWLLTDNAAALVSEGGHRVLLDNSQTVDENGMVLQGQEIVMSNLRGGIFLTLVTVALVGIGVVLFRRRDLQ